MQVVWLLRLLFASWLGISLSVGVLKDCLCITWWFIFHIFSSFVKLFIPASEFCFCCSTLFAGGGGEIRRVRGVHRYLASEWGQPTAPFKQFTKFLASI